MNEVSFQVFDQYSVKLTRRQALRALLGKPVTVSGSRVAPLIPFKIRHATVEVYGGGGGGAVDGGPSVATGGPGYRWSGVVGRDDGPLAQGGGGGGS